MNQILNSSARKTTAIAIKSKYKESKRHGKVNQSDTHTGLRIDKRMPYFIIDMLYWKYGWGLGDLQTKISDFECRKN